MGIHGEGDATVAAGTERSDEHALVHGFEETGEGLAALLL
jgi:hypothetical protein